MRADVEFVFWDYLIADLKRARFLHGKTCNDVSFLKLASGLFSPRFVPVLLCRLAYVFYLWRFSPIAKFFSLLNFMLFGIEIALPCHIGRGIYFPHTSGTVIGAHHIGENVTVFQGVTLGAREMDFQFDKSARPSVDSEVTIGSGAKILGGISIGKGARIGANAVLLQSVPAGVFVAGVPAKIVKEI